MWGGLVGAAALLLLQEVLSAYTEHWEFWTGWVLLAVVLFARQGLVGLLGSAASAAAAPMNVACAIANEAWLERRPSAQCDEPDGAATPLLDVRGSRSASAACSRPIASTCRSGAARCMR